MWEERARSTRREVAALAASGIGVQALFTQAIEAVQRVVPSEVTCWAVLDPETAVISAMVNGPVPVPAEYEPLLAVAEYSADEPHTFVDLARRRVPVAVLSDLEHGARAASRRMNTVWRPLGLEQEARVVFLGADGVAWGAAGMVRAHGGFSAREVEYLGAVAPVLATATRLAVRAEVLARVPAPGPAVLVVGMRGRTRSLTAQAEEWRARFEDLAPGRFDALLRLMLSGMAASRSGAFEARLRDGLGGWAVLRATPLIGDDGEQAAVTIESAGASDLRGPVLLSFGLTPRERAVCEQVLAGRSTAEIAAALFISEHTVQDHLKAVFDKVGVRSRRRLVASLAADRGPAPGAAPATGPGRRGTGSGPDLLGQTASSSGP